MEAESARSDSVSLDSAQGRWVVAVAVLGSGVAFLEATVVNVALPEIGADLGADTAGLQWVLNGYLLTLASLILLGGSLGDRLGRRLVFNVGVAWFTAASVLCAVAPSVEVLVAARVLQGIGGALLTPGSLAIIEATFRKQDRAAAIGAWSGLGGVAAAVGPLLGGYLVDEVSWRAIFLLNIPLGAFVIVMANRHVPESRDSTVHGRLDYPGATLAALGLAGTTVALIQAPEPGGAGLTALAAGVGVLALAGFLVVERRSPNPMMPLSVFASRQFSAANLVTFAVYAALGSVFFLLVAFLQISLGYSAVAAGSASLPVTVLMLALSARSGALAQRIGARIPLTVGPLVIAAGMLLMAMIEPGDSYVAAVLPGVVVFGLGLTLVVAPVTATALAAADERHAGVASGINNAVARVAGLLAVAVLPLLAGLTGDAFYDPEAMTEGFRTAMFIAAGLAAAGSLVAFSLIRPDVLETEPSSEDADTPGRTATDRSCPIAGTPLRPSREAECVPAGEPG
ncbi:MAG: DHA2 family efflux MFS transporter permease subunit [Solirubrobacterales bacterium]|nr:DHA2 family efflux MFS transporter permease subunit [Solirubrobacterales bacterium]